MTHETNQRQYSSAKAPATQEDAIQPPSLFPLPVAPFEQYMMADDRPGYPMAFPIHVELEGEPDCDAMNDALSDAFQRHPLLSARLTGRGAKRRWIAADGQAEIKWRTSAERLGPPPIEQIDLKHGPGVRITGDVHDGRTELHFLFHHAACDGIGAFCFIGDLLAGYGQRKAQGDNRPHLLPIDTALLRQRADFDIHLPGAVSTKDILLSSLQESWRLVSRRPQCLANRPRPEVAGPARLHSLVLDEDAYREYCRRATDLSVTANDLMVRDMFLSLDAWNRPRGGGNGWLRITMPTSLRGKRDIRAPAANILGYAFVTRHTKDLADPAGLLAGLAAETQSIRDWSLGALFVDGLRSAARIPGLLEAITRLSRRFATVVLSNVGNPARRFRARFPTDGKRIVAGNLRLLNLCGAPPVRPGTRAALALTTYGDCLTMGMMVDPRWLSDDDAAEFLAIYRRRLLTSVSETD